jgi:hypothetical protein
MPEPVESTIDSEDAELKAIQAILSALAGLDAQAKERVFDYVFRRLGIARAPTATSTPTVVVASHAPLAPRGGQVPAAPSAPSLTDVRSFASTKQPSTDMERVAVVAYFLSELASGSDHKPSITAEDITKYFKQANFPLPARPRQTLHNAKNAGYLDAAAETGAFRLNPVGHNLVVHGLPSAAGAKAKVKAKSKKKPAGR